MSELENEPVELPLLAKPKNSRVEYVDSAEALAEAVLTLSECTGWFALDAERASGFKYSNRAYLVQVCRGDSPIFLIDPAAIAPEIGGDEFVELATLLASDGWILHAATQDLPCLQELGLFPPKLFDTELAGRLLGLPRVGLGAMVERYLSVRLAKEHSAVDWSTRPLQTDWLNYAALDVDVLEALMVAVHADLEAAKKLEIAEQEFEHLLNFKPKAPKTDKWRGTTGLHEVKDQRGLAIARELWMAREELAKRIDVAPGRLIPDLSITAVVKNPPVARSALAEMKNFVGRASRSYLDVWWKALSEGLQTNKLPPVKIPLEGIPHHRNWAQRYPEADARLNRLKQVMATLAEQFAMPSENILSPDSIRQLCWEPPADISVESVSDFLAGRKARKWQIDAVAGEFTKALTDAADLANAADLASSENLKQN